MTRQIRTVSLICPMTYVCGYNNSNYAPPAGPLATTSICLVRTHPSGILVFVHGAGDEILCIDPGPVLQTVKAATVRI
jgi:hypothetical protein